MINKRLREAALTGVPVLGLGIVVYKAFKHFLRDAKNETKPGKDPLQYHDLTPDGQEQLKKEVDRSTCLDLNYNSHNNHNSDNSGSNCHKSRDDNNNNNTNTNSNTNSNNNINHNDVDSNNSNNFLNKSSNNNSRGSVVPLRKNPEVVLVYDVIARPVDDVTNDEMKSKLDEIESGNTRLTSAPCENYSDEFVLERRPNRWSLESMENTRRSSFNNRNSWTSQGSSASESSSTLSWKMKDGQKVPDKINSALRRASLESSVSLEVMKRNPPDRAKPDAHGPVVTRMFDFPSDLCGRLIGKLGRNVGLVKKKSGAEVTVKPKVYTTDYQTVCLQGNQQQVGKAESLIRKKFPERKYLHVDYSRHLPDVPVTPPAITQVTLSPDTIVEVSMINVVSGNHFFLHQVTHPTYGGLQKLTLDMSKCYELDPSVPSLPRSREVGVVCAVPMYGFWCRCQITRTFSQSDTCEVKLVDYGGYTVVRGSSLKQIRTDFLSIPFQAIECYLANLIPSKDGQEFCPEMKEALEKLVGVAGLKAKFVRLESDGIPYVTLEEKEGDEVLSVNKRMADNGWAVWTDFT